MNRWRSTFVLFPVRADGRWCWRAIRWAATPVGRSRVIVTGALSSVLWTLAELDRTGL